MASIPIPERGSGTCYEELQVLGRCMGDVVEQLGRGKVRRDYHVHLDPDLDPTVRARSRGWRPSLGQVAAAQGVLRREGVREGDLFLFFGWFRQVEEVGGQLRFVHGAPNLHVLFGWLQVGQVIDVAMDPIPDWARDHPHVINRDRTANTIYVAPEYLRLGGETLSVPGGGVFRRLHPSLVLTAPAQRKRSVWRLPAWFMPGPGRPALGYHSDPDRWRLFGNRVELLSAARGQEFVLDCGYYPEAIPWVRGLLDAR